MTTRRSWSKIEKRAIVAEIDAAGGPVSDVARRHGLHTSPWFRWRRDLAEAKGPTPPPRSPNTFVRGAVWMGQGLGTVLLAGAPRSFTILNGTLAAAIGRGLRLWIAGVLIWVVGHAVAVWVTRKDPEFLTVLSRHARHKGALAC
jgi:type IV secretion system protein TrbD